MKVPIQLLEKYNIPVPRYTSYPPANFFDANFSTQDYLAAVEESNSLNPQNISFYVHIPFCTSLCYYCGCNTHISKSDDLKRRYINALKKEIKMISPLLDKSRKVSQIHWGGGTPNALPAAMIGEVMQVFRDEFEFTPRAELAIECNPAALDANYIQALYDFGFNRMSIGVQDFRTDVLNAVNREVPNIPIKEMIEIIRAKGQMSINLDFIYGLPHQTADSFVKTMQQAIALNVERLVTFSYAHVPWVKQSQKQLEKHGLPSSNEKLLMFETAWQQLCDANYLPIGLDHYAKNTDALAKALLSKELHRNFQGYCTRETTGQVYAFGTTGISQLETVYAQNARTVKEYIAAINEGKIIIEKGYRLNESEKLTRHIINELMCNQYLSWDKLASQFNQSIEDLQKQLEFRNSKLDEFALDGLLSYTDKDITVSNEGRFVLRNIASLFDLNLKGTTKKFSQSV
ncbi:MAG: oxygen-independent coproporphyrinogen III oxidase [Mangrovibacterium sp.]